jgi:hypothetical protein
VSTIIAERTTPETRPNVRMIFFMDGAPVVWSFAALRMTRQDRREVGEDASPERMIFGGRRANHSFRR